MTEKILFIISDSDRRIKKGDETKDADEEIDVLNFILIYIGR